MAERSLPAALVSAALWAAVVFTGGLAIYGTRPPTAISASSPTNVFSASRAITHLAAIAKAPHPIGSEEAVRVREYLLRELSALGAEVHVEQGIGTAQYGRNIHSGVVNNVVATFPGRANTRALMLVAHYDSVAEGPGAADDGAGVVVILESLRALRAAAPVKNELVVLFSDGEEARGLLGALAFAGNHPDLANRIGVMVNLEARGSSGPGLMFETSDDNGALIREFARAAPYPMATSLMTAIYKLLPNDTDFTPFKAAGLTGLNFAFLETYQNYHTRLDTAANLDPRSVQHLGDNLLGVIRHFGNLDRPLPKQTDLVYFNWFGAGLLIYSVRFAWAIAVLAPVLFAIACWRAAPRLGLTFGRIAFGFAAFVVQLAVIVGVTFALFVIVKFIAGELLEGDTLSNRLLFAGVIAIAFGAGVATQRFLGRKLRMANLAGGQLFAIALLTALLCWFLMGGSYVLQWPLLFGMAGLVIPDRLEGPARTIGRFVCLVPALLILVPLAYMFFVSLLFSYAGLGAAAFLLSVLLAMAPDLFDQLVGRGRVFSIALGSVSLCLLAVGVRLSHWSTDNPRRDTLIYSVNADVNKAKWVSYDAAPDNWTTELFGSHARRQSDPMFTVGVTRPVFSSDTTMVPLSPPQVTITENYMRDGEQTVRVQVTSTRNARSLVARLPGDLRLTAAGWNGNIQPLHDTSPNSGPWTFRFYNAPSEGASLEFRFASQKGVKLWVADSTPGLPEIMPLPPRPNDTMPAYGSDVTIVARSTEL